MVKKLKLSRFFSIVLFCSIFYLLFSCSDNSDQIEIEKVEVNFTINRLDNSLFNSESKASVKDIVDNNRRVFNKYLELDKLPNDSILINFLYNRITNPSVDSFYQQCDSVFGDFERWNKEIETLFKHVKFYYPNFKEPEVSTLFTAFLTPMDILIDQNDIIIGLEYFIGQNAMYVSKDPEYILNRYNPDNLVPLFIGLGISNFFNNTNHEDNSLVAEMIYYGKSQYFLEQMGVDMTQSEMLGYNDDQKEYVENNEAAIWAYFIENDLLFETNRIETSKFVSERPSVLEISPDCPGRIGRWVGYKIVKSYAEKTNLGIRELMAEEDAQMIFRKSKYNPSN